MLKHNHIIRQLTDSDKIHLLSDIHRSSDKEYKVLGIPAIKIGYWEDYCNEDYPSIAELSHSWDTDLIVRVAHDIFARMVQDDITLAIIPGPKSRISPFRQALCEDPVLARSLTNAYLTAAKANGLSCCISDFSLYEDELEWIDTPLDTRAIREYMIKPYMDIAVKNECAAIMMEYAHAEENSPNQLFFDAVKNGELGTHVTPLFHAVSDKYTVQAIANGDLCVKCSAPALESALNRYHQLKQNASDTTSEEALSQECAQGRAISPEALDIATDRLIEFAYSIKRRIATSDTIDASLPLTAALESIVLLKNEQFILPLSTQKKVCIIGDFPSESGDTPNGILAEQVEQQLATAGYTIIGTARGYDINSHRSEALIPDAVALVDQADAAIIFLGPNSVDEAKITQLKHLSIPANQQQLLDNLREYKNKVIAILPGKYPLDIGLADYCSAILQAPMRTRHSIPALVRVINGQHSPSGKLANTIYLDSTKQHALRKNLRLRDGMKVGPFMGYRYYDREQSNPGFPFGHGQSYSTFSYSQFSISNDKVSLTVTNEGAQSASEIVQVYVGRAGSPLLHPAKELVAFAKVALEPGEQKTIELALEWPLTFFQTEKRWVREQGRYTVYVGDSISSIHWTHTVNVAGEMLEADNAKISDYIPSESNIIIDQFILEAKRKPMKKSAFNFVAGAVSLALAIALKLYCQFTNSSTTFFNIFTLILLFSGVSFFIQEAVNRNRAQHAFEQEQQKTNNQLFEDAETVPVYSAPAMFVKEFDEVEDISQDSNQNKEKLDNNAMTHVSKEYTLSDAVEDFIYFAAEKGYRFSEQTVANIFSALTSSRLALVYDMDQNRFRSFMSTLSSFFESPLYLDTVDAKYTQPERVLFKNDGAGQSTKTNAFSAIEAARTTPQKIFFAALTEVRASDLSHYFIPYANHAQNPYAHLPVSVFNDTRAETSYFIPENLWFVLNLAKEQPVVSLPGFVADAATLNTFAFDACKPATSKPRLHKFTYYQMEYLAERSGAITVIEEDQWKKVDRLVESVSSRKPFHIGNKLWLHFEKYVLSLLACEIDVHEALDTAISAKLLPPIIVFMKDDEAAQSGWLLRIVEDVLGDEHRNACKQLLDFDSRKSSK